MSEETKKTDDVEVETTEQNNEESQENATYTQAELDRQISLTAEKIKRKAKEEAEKEYAERIEQERNEAAEYAKLTQKEQEEADYKKRLDELEKREQEINKRQLRNQIEQDLKDNQLPTKLADTLVHANDNTKIKESIVEMKTWLDDAVNEQVKARLRQDTPSASTKEINNDPFSRILNKYK